MVANSIGNLNLRLWPYLDEKISLLQEKGEGEKNLWEVFFLFSETKRNFLKLFLFIFLAKKEGSIHNGKLKYIVQYFFYFSLVLHKQVHLKLMMNWYQIHVSLLKPTWHWNGQQKQWQPVHKQVPCKFSKILI